MKSDSRKIYRLSWARQAFLGILLITLAVCAGCVQFYGRRTYVSPKQTFAVQFPLSPHPLTIHVTTNSVRFYEQIDFVDVYGLEMGMYVTQTPGFFDPEAFIQGTFSNIPNETVEGDQTLKLEKEVRESELGRMIVCMKGPRLTPEGYQYEMGGILPRGRYVYDFYATSYPFCRKVERARKMARDQFAILFGKLTLLGDKGAESNKVTGAGTGRTRPD